MFGRNNKTYSNNDFDERPRVPFLLFLLTLLCVAREEKS